MDTAKSDGLQEAVDFYINVLGFSDDAETRRLCQFRVKVSRLDRKEEDHDGCSPAGQ